MDATLDLSRWRAAPLGVGYRRWTIISAGLRQLLRTRLFRILLAVAWVGGALIALGALLFSQIITGGGWVGMLTADMGARVQAVTSAIGALVLLYPDVCVGGVFTLFLWLHSYLGLGLSLVALTAVVPRLVTRDRASHALTIYLSKPLTSADYLLGKLGIIVGVLVLLWTGPLLCGWLLSMLFAPNADFVTYSVGPLFRGLLFNALGLVTLATIALGVSALSRTSRNTVLIWIGLWVIMGAVANDRAPVWIQRASFTHNLKEVRQSTFRLDAALAEASATLPVLNRSISADLAEAGRQVEADDGVGALAALGAFCFCSSLVFFRKLRPE